MAVRKIVPADQVAARNELKGLRNEIINATTIADLRSCLLKLFKAVKG